MKKQVTKGEIIVLIDEKQRKYFIDTRGKTDKIKGVGVIDPTSLIGYQYGKQYKIRDKKFWVMQPSIMDKMQGLKRKAQIILPKDASQIIIECSIETGHKILEAGIGSASLTIALASTVAPTGKIISYDIRKDFIEHAIKNLKQSSLEKYVTVIKKDVTNGIKEKNLDLFTTYLPS